MINQKQVTECFEYKDGTLYWRGVTRQNKQYLVDKPAGSLHKTGYRHVTWMGKVHKAHRLIFLLHHGYLPKEIDHINGDRADNRIENLRAVTRSQNQYNKGKCRNNTSGHRGVSWHKPTGKWSVRISLNNRNKSMGYYDDLELAAFIAEEARLKYYGEYAKEAQ